MTELQGLVDRDLSRHSIRDFWEVQVATDAEGRTNTAKPEAFLSKELAEFRAKAGHFGKAVPILVLVAEGDTELGIALTGLNTGKNVALVNDGQEKLNAIEEILAKLTPAERALLGHPDPDPDEPAP